MLVDDSLLKNNAEGKIRKKKIKEKKRKKKDCRKRGKSSYNETGEYGKTQSLVQIMGMVMHSNKGGGIPMYN